MREVAQGDELCGYPVPKGTIVTIVLGALHRYVSVRLILHLYWKVIDLLC